MRQPYYPGGHPDQVRGLEPGMAMAAEVAVAEVVGQDDHDVRPRRRVGRAGRPRQGRDGGGEQRRQACGCHGPPSRSWYVSEEIISPWAREPRDQDALRSVVSWTSSLASF